MPAYIETNQTTNNFRGKRGEMPGTRYVSYIFIEKLEITKPFDNLVYPSISWKKNYGKYILDSKK